MSSSRGVFIALIRTHHITSRKKIFKLKKAASQNGIDYVMIRSGGCPGIMYAQGSTAESVGSWVAAVQALRYKDYRCVQRPTKATILETNMAKRPIFQEVTSTTEFGVQMDLRGLGDWWRQCMGYVL